MTDFMLIFDYETANLSIENPVPLEFAYALVQFDGGILQVLDKDSWLIGDTHRLNEWPSADMEPMVHDMHVNSGLYHEWINEPNKATHRDIEIDLLKAFSRYDVEPGNISASGSGISEFDRPIMRKFMPEIESFFHYRSLDLGSFNRIINIMKPGLIDRDVYPFNNVPHRAMGDVEQFIDQWKMHPIAR